MKQFEKDSPSGEVILNWWNELQTNTGNRADLRKCIVPSEPTHIRTCHALISKLSKLNEENETLSGDKICAIAGILSHVKENHSVSVAKQMSQTKSGSEQPLISEIRFRRILQYKDITEDELFFQKMIRLVHHLDKKINIIDLFDSLYYWGDMKKKKWAYDYYGTTYTSENNDTEQQDKDIAQGANNG